MLGHAFGVAGNFSEAHAILNQLRGQSARRFLSSYCIAEIYLGLGDRNQASDWLEKAYSERDGTLVWLKVHPRLDGLRGEPRFRDLLARLRLDS